jgi:hypothetical protein
MGSPCILATALDVVVQRSPAVALGPPSRSASGSSVLLDRLEAEERARDAERAAGEAEDREERLARERAEEAARRREAAERAEAARVLALRLAAMREWHGSFATTLEPVLRAREALYHRMVSRRFARLLPQCEDIASAVTNAAAHYQPAPERRVDVLARELLAVYAESARHCATGAYFSFTVQERRVRFLAGELIAAFEAFGLAFPRARDQP